MRIRPSQDRRRKLTEDDKIKIRSLYQDGSKKFGKRALARLYGVDKATIRHIVDPAWHKQEMAKRKKNKVWLKYYDKERWRAYMRDHRKYRKELYLNNNLLNYHGVAKSNANCRAKKTIDN